MKVPGWRGCVELLSGRRESFAAASRALNAGRLMFLSKLGRDHGKPLNNDLARM